MVYCSTFFIEIFFLDIILQETKINYFTKMVYCSTSNENYIEEGQQEETEQQNLKQFKNQNSAEERHKFLFH